jgi:hypothetical protein
MDPVSAVHTDEDRYLTAEAFRQNTDAQGRWRSLTRSVTIKTDSMESALARHRFELLLCQCQKVPQILHHEICCDCVSYQFYSCFG